MEFTRIQKAAIAVLLGEMGAADGKMDEREALMMHAIGSSLDADASIASLASSMTPSDACGVVSQMSADEKKFVCAALGAMMSVDNEINESEKILWCVISATCGLPGMSIREAYEYFMKR